MKYTLGKHNLTGIYEYNDFLEYSKQSIEELDGVELDETGKKFLEFKKINIVRSLRIAKTYKPDKELLELFKKIEGKQTWLIFTEDWCGDSAQNLPYLMKYTSLNPNLDVKIILRDDNIQALKDYFGKDNPLSIPRIVAFDENRCELFRWGPRPAKAQELVNRLKQQGLPKEELNKKLHLWYARNKGKELEKEFTDIIGKLVY